MLLICITVFLSYLPEAGQYSSFFLYLRQVSRCPFLAGGWDDSSLHRGELGWRRLETRRPRGTHRLRGVTPRGLLFLGPRQPCGQGGSSRSWLPTQVRGALAAQRLCSDAPREEHRICCLSSGFCALDGCLVSLL